ncbi:MAG: hypothetical protein ACE5DM_00530 [Candidatus Nanoarchaeia archaeon]
MILGKKGRALVTVLIIVVVVLVVMLVADKGSTTGHSIRFWDKCERTYNACVDDCGDGLLGGLCKDKCTWDRKQCRKG